MGQAYFGTQLSPNIIRLANGSIVAKNAKLSRSGWQTYLPEELRVHSTSPLVKVYRDPADVFAPSAVASATAAPLTDRHPPQFVEPHNWNIYARGICQGAKRGGTYEDGEYLVGDLVLTDSELISKFESGVRHLSVGYNYRLICFQCKKPVTSENNEPVCECDNPEQFQQKDIIINHIALVPSGRAGGAEILDSGESVKHLVTEETKSGGVPATAKDVASKNVRPLMKKDFWKTIMGLGLKEFAKDADPKDLAAAVEPEGEDSDPGAVERNEKFDKRALARTEERNSHDMKTKDAEKEVHGPSCKCDDCMDSKPFTAKDAKKLQDGMAEMMAELRAKKDGEKKEESKDRKAKDDMPDDDEDMEGMDSWKKSIDAWKASTDSALSHIKDGLEELLKGGGTAKGGKEIEEEENKPAMDKKKGKDAEESNVPPTENETTPEEELSENKKVEDDDVDIIPALPKEDRPENPIPGADAALAVLRAQASFVQDASNFRTKKAQQQAIDAHNATVRAIKGRGLYAVDRGNSPTYGDLNKTKKPEGLQGHDNAPKTDAARGAEYEEMMKEHAKKFRAQFPSSSKVS